MRLRSINVFSAYLGDPDKTKERTRLLRNDSDFLDREFALYTRFVNNDYFMQLNIECDPEADSIHVSQAYVRGYPTVAVPFDHSNYQKLTDPEKRTFWITTVKDVFDFAKPLMNCSFEKIDDYIDHLEKLKMRGGANT